MDKKAFDRAREEFRKKTSDLSEEELSEQVKELVERERARQRPTPRLLGVTYAMSSVDDHSEASLTLTSSSGA